MMKLVLIGTKDAKRTEYFRKAASHIKEPVTFVEWDELEDFMGGTPSREKYVIKIDPPTYQTCHLSDMRREIRGYQEQLYRLQNTGYAFLNTPDSILALLDKAACKSRLQAAGLPVTRMIAGEIGDTEQLISTMYEKHEYAVFIKPAFFSGAAGVVALRLHPHSRKMSAYTSCRLEQGVPVNTKTLCKLEDAQKICELLDVLLSMDAVIERWHPKESFQGKSYDLRVVYQFGHISFLVARQSKGPVTNLHLNNQAKDIGALGLEQEKIVQIEELCSKAVGLFPGLSMAGIDILLEKNTGKPLIIEMNGQGDLIYQDIYGENRIYREQVMHMTGKFSG